MAIITMMDNLTRRLWLGRGVTREFAPKTMFFFRF